MNLVILVGLPGSGKTTFCQKHYPTYTRISQDELGSREACINACHQALEQGQNVIIDRTNINKQQRRYWVELGLNFGVEEIRCVLLSVNEEECIARIDLRKNHPTINFEMPLDEKQRIVYNFSKSFEIPSLSEGFNVIELRKG